MKLRDWLERTGLAFLSMNPEVLEQEWAPNEADRKAAWELSIELRTRIATQNLAPEEGDEKTALESIFQLFALTRQSLKAHHGCGTCATIAIAVLNQIVRPFTAKWHRLSVAGVFADAARCAEFRTELAALQKTLRRYTQALGDMAGTEDFTTPENGAA